MEIERKFIVEEGLLLENVKLDSCECYDIFQFYVCTNDEAEVRARRKEGKLDSEYSLTIKTPGDLVRAEIEIPISRGNFMELLTNKVYSGNTIDKRRYVIPYNNLNIEVDVYGSNLFGLVVAEVEFESIKAANEFVPPAWFDKEVTKMPKYKNRSLATCSYHDL